MIPGPTSPRGKENLSRTGNVVPRQCVRRRGREGSLHPLGVIVTAESVCKNSSSRSPAVAPLWTSSSPTRTTGPPSTVGTYPPGMPDHVKQRNARADTVEPFLRNTNNSDSLPAVETREQTALGLATARQDLAPSGPGGHEPAAINSNGGLKR